MRRQVIVRDVEEQVNQAVAEAIAQAQVQVAPAPPPALPGDPIASQISSATARDIYEAKEQQREVLGEQLSRLLRRRNDVSEQMNSPETSGAERAALEQHYVALNGRIIAMEKEIQRADAEWAAAAAVPGATVEPPSPRPDGPPEEMLVLGTIFFGISMVILAAAVARRILKGGAKVMAQIPASLEGRFTRLEQSVDAVAIEVERISEGQRFLTRVFAEQNPRIVAGEPETVRRG